MTYFELYIFCCDKVMEEKERLLKGDDNWDRLRAAIVMRNRVKKKLEYFIDGIKRRGSRKSVLTIL
jgi:hypothetical protein